MEQEAEAVETEESAEEMPSYADLDAAAAEVEEEVIEEVPPTEESEEQEVVEEPEAEPVPVQEEVVEEPAVEPEVEPEPDPYEKRMRNVEGRIGTMLSNQKTVLDRLEAIASQGVQEQPAEPVEYPQDTTALTGMVTKVYQQEKQKEQQVEAAYQGQYEQAVVTTITAEADADQKGIEEEFFAHHNKRNTENGAYDGEKNVMAAALAYYKKKAASPVVPKKVNPVEDTKPVAPLGGVTTQTVKKSAPKPIELDEHAAEFVKSTGMKPEDVQKSLSGPAPSYLRSGR